MRRRFSALSTSIAVLLTFLVLPAQPASAAPFRALLFSETAGYRHDSIPAGIAMFNQLATENGFTVVASEDSAVFTPANLATFDVVIMFQTSGMVWDNDAQRQAIQGYVAAGGGIAAIHNATDMGIESSFPWWDNLVNGGAHMPEHSPGVLPGTAHVADRAHPSTVGLPDRWNRSEEWYNFDRNPRGDVHVLVTADERTYNPGGAAMGADHPISWCREAEGGRVWTTAMGHAASSYSETLFRQHLLGGVQWAAGDKPGDCGGTIWGNFEKVALDENTVDPMALDIAADGRVFYIQRAGQLKIFKPASSSTVTSGTLSVYTGGEDGLVGMALDPNFATNNWIYLYYSPSAATTDINRLSRFTVNGDTLDPASERVLLDVPAYRSRTNPEPGHTGGYVAFGPGGNLYLSVGDDTPPNYDPAWQGYAPLDWRSGRSFLDAARSAGNTNDLRGKILRIHPEPGGTYTIPSGNLFSPGTANTRPEIYAMGFRNPFRFQVDPQTGWINMADYGPDRSGPATNRGPEGLVEINVIKQAGNFGWPFCHGNNQAYAPYNPDTGVVGAKFNCNAPVNNSPNNTGLTTLPPLVQPQVWYGYGTSPEFPELGEGGAAPMGGPVYRYNAASTSPTKFPAYYDGVHFFYEWARNYVKEIHFDANGGLLKINPFLPGVFFNKPMDMRFGPDGSLYLLEWGANFGGGNNDSGLYRIDYSSGDRSPIAKATATPNNGRTPLTVQFSSAGSYDPDPGDVITYAWDLDGNGSTDSTAPNPSRVYTSNGNITARLTVTDNTGKSAFANVPVTVGNTAPTVAITGPPNGGMLDFGQQVAYTVSVTDPEDGTVNCTQVFMNPALGHDDHQHPTSDYAGCSGTVSTELLGGHPDGANLYYVLNARYQDNGAGSVARLTGYANTILQPKHKQAEYFTGMSGVRVIDQAGAESGKRIGDVSNNDWIMFDPMSLQGITSVSYRLSSPSGGGSIELRADSPTGQLLATAPVASTGGWDTYVSQAAVPVTALTGTHKLYMVFKSSVGNNFDVDSFTFGGAGVGTTPSGGIAGRTWTLTATHSGKLADVSGVSTADGAVVHQWAATGGTNQRWQAVDAGGGTVQLKAVHSGKCMAVTGGSTAAGTGVSQVPCGTAASQRWQPVAQSGGVYELRAAHSGQCLDVNGNSMNDGATLIQWGCGGGANQRWRLTQVA
ncbi:glucose/arabinose dehydrogenase [Micromonospora pisi]|uniref:Glucose/arabinose dehydrogenase n=1 Tax=Micromonospora pisi TaxID=589240 RepID=A0A495JUQ8_9ACTN|nr:ThuA domain-containing protein [Micromonospora pisi]RKR92094.1 glucose/arabinose dehydrogenase [Micromonospora pisi]